MRSGSDSLTSTKLSLDLIPAAAVAANVPYTCGTSSESGTASNVTC